MESGLTDLLEFSILLEPRWDFRKTLDLDVLLHMDLTLNKGLATSLHAVVLLTNTEFNEKFSQATRLQPAFECWHIEDECMSIAAYVLGLSILQKETVPERFPTVFLRASRLVPISGLARALESLIEDELYQWSYLLIGRHQQIDHEDMHLAECIFTLSVAKRHHGVYLRDASVI